MTGFHSSHVDDILHMPLVLILQMKINLTNYWSESLRLTPWYSPSDSYLQIDSPDDAVQPCDSRLELPITYITEDLSTSGPLTFVYQVLGLYKESLI